MTPPNDVTIDLRRGNSADHPALIEMARCGSSRFGYAVDLGIPKELAQLLRLRVSQINKCSYCLNVHNGAARDVGIRQAKIDMLIAWRETEIFSDAERSALAYTEALTRMNESDIDRFQSVHDGLVQHFDESARLEIVGVVINMNIWTRLKLAEGATPALS